MSDGGGYLDILRHADEMPVSQRVHGFAGALVKAYRKGHGGECDAATVTLLRAMAALLVVIEGSARKPESYGLALAACHTLVGLATDLGVALPADALGRRLAQRGTKLRWRHGEAERRADAAAR